LKNKIQKIDAIILCGGYGKRIEQLTKNKISKTILNIGNKQFLDYLLKKISLYPFNKIILLAGFKGEIIKKKYHRTKSNLIDVECIIEKKPEGTARALYKVKKYINNDFILFNGDTFFDCDLSFFFKSQINQNYLSHILLTKNFELSKTKNLLNLNLNKNKTLFFSKKTNLINGGVIFMKKKILNLIKKNNLSLENEIINKLILKKKIIGTLDKGFFVDIGTKKNYLMAIKIIPSMFLKPALFLDQDGVINKDFGYVNKIKRLKYNKNIFKILRTYQKKFFLFIVTNQSGIARGYYNVSQFYQFQRKIKNDLFLKNILINDVEYCPHHIENIIKKYKKICSCRKPKTGMIKNLKKKWNIIINKSFFIGDRKSDELCAKKSNIKFLYFNNKNLKLI
jgi:D-glycero-D-manno-heptose 1,7-bisphosphate phosphatase